MLIACAVAGVLCEGTPGYSAAPRVLGVSGRYQEERVLGVSGRYQEESMLAMRSTMKKIVKNHSIAAARTGCYGCCRYCRVLPGTAGCCG